jgi:hypothetical protein
MSADDAPQETPFVGTNTLIAAVAFVVFHSTTRTADALIVPSVQDK